MSETVVDVAVLGAGPAGLEAGVAAARALAAGSPSRRMRVALVDGGLQAGGQVWRPRRQQMHPRAHALMRDLHRLDVHTVCGARVVALDAERRLLLDQPDGSGSTSVRWQRLILATGARERLVPFAGWTLPGVFAAGGLQALTKGGWPVAGRRVVVAGTGPLLLATAATLLQEGARVAAIVDEAPAAAWARLAAAMPAHPALAWQALVLGLRLSRVPRWHGHRIAAAEGESGVERVVIESLANGARTALPCDVLAAGWGLVPECGLAEMLGCSITGRFGARAVQVDAHGRTTVEGVFAAGETAGVAGARAARLTGRAAGLAAAQEVLLSTPGRAGHAAPSRRLAREWRFAERLARLFPPPRDLAARMTAQTIVCRCEDVAWQELRTFDDLRLAKLATRCGMGHCQGRICHDILSAITGASGLPPHAPLVPVRIGALLASFDLSPAPAPAASVSTESIA